MNAIKIITILILFSLLSACSKDETTNLMEIQLQENNFSTNNHFILLNGIELEIKGVVYTPNYPGYSPLNIEKELDLPSEYQNSILKDIRQIKEMGANTIRLWTAPQYTYQAIKETKGLFFLQTIWINAEQSDYQSSSFKEQSKAYIRAIIDRVYSVFDNSKPPLIAYIVGNELKKSNIEATNKAHPEITSYSGKYIQTSNINASQAFIAEMADYIKSYEFENYQNVSLVSYANEISTPYVIDTPFLDFRSHNVYSWLRPDLNYLPHIPLTSTGSSSGTLYQGWIEDLKAMHPNMPLLITETGLSISPDADHIGAPNYGYGGNTETEQSTSLLQNINDIKTAKLPIAGVCIHEYLDAWWKSGKLDAQESAQVEEWFGLVNFRKVGSWYETDFRESYSSIKALWKQ